MKKKDEKGTSMKRVKANRKNSARSTGPKTETGKLRSGMNALKHGIFASELKVSKEEKPEFELLHRALYTELGPASPLQQIGFERFLWACWRWKRVLRLEMNQLKAHLDFNENAQHQTDTPSESVLPTHWYGASKRELREASAFLSNLRQDVETSGWIHADAWKDPVTKAFGHEFYALLTEWVPMDVSAIQAAMHLPLTQEISTCPCPQVWRQI